MKYILPLIACLAFGTTQGLSTPAYAQTGSIAYPCNTKPFTVRHSDKERYILTGLLKTESDIEQIKEEDTFYDEDTQDFYVKYSFQKQKDTQDLSSYQIASKKNHAIFNEFILPKGVKNLHVFFTDDTDKTLQYVLCKTSHDKKQEQ